MVYWNINLIKMLLGKEIYDIFYSSVQEKIPVIIFHWRSSIKFRTNSFFILCAYTINKSVLSMI